MSGTTPRAGIAFVGVLKENSNYEDSTEDDTESPATCQDSPDNGLHPELGSPSETRARALSQDFRCHPTARHASIGLSGRASPWSMVHP